MSKPVRKNAHASDPSRHTVPARKSTTKTRRVGPSASQREELPRRHGKRNAIPHRPNEGQPPGHVGRH